MVTGKMRSEQEVLTGLTPAGRGLPVVDVLLPHYSQL